MTAGYWAPHFCVNSTKRSLAAVSPVRFRPGGCLWRSDRSTYTMRSGMYCATGIEMLEKQQGNPIRILVNPETVQYAILVGGAGFWLSVALAPSGNN
jgi:hypothetical protein